MSGRDLHRAGAKLGFHKLISDDWNFTIDDWQNQNLADHRSVTLIVGIHGDRGVADIVSGRVVATVIEPSRFFN